MHKTTFAVFKASLAAVAACAFATSATSALAQAGGAAAGYPAKPVTIIAPNPPGGGADGDGRVWAQKLTEATGKSFVLDYKPGAGGTIGANYVAKAAPDGYTLLFVTSGFAVTAVMHPSLPYDAMKDFAPVSLTLVRATLLAAHPSAPFSTFPQYVTYAQAHPGEINFATTGAGSVYHLVGAWLNSTTGTKTTFVHYKGAGPLLLDLAAGRTHVGPTSFLAGWQLVKPGKLKAIAIMSPQRSDLAPDLKTIAEQGIPDFDYSAWSGIIAPAATPAAITTKLSDQLAALAKDPATIEYFKSTGATLICNTPAQFRAYLTTLTGRWARLMKENGIQQSVDD